jgi:hypothetical protein
MKNPNYILRKFVIKLSEKDYHDFLRISNQYGLEVEEKIYEIIEYYLLIERGRFKTRRINHDFQN